MPRFPPPAPPPPYTCNRPGSTCAARLARPTKGYEVRMAPKQFPAPGFHGRHVLVVGAGSSGCVLARRLTDDGTAAVTLLETGRDLRTADRPSRIVSPNPMDVIADRDWTFPRMRSRRTPEQRPRLYWRGRGMGGSSTVNGMQAIRGTPEDFDRWAGEEGGCEGWTADDVLPFFRKFESDLDFDDVDTVAHGGGGPLPVMRLDEHNRDSWGAMDCALYDAAMSMGWAEVPDHNSFQRNMVGISRFARNDILSQGSGGTTDGAVGRVSVYDAFIEPVRNDPGRQLRILTDAHVDKLLVGSEGRCEGVQLCSGDTIRASEVIVCGGAVHTPAILQRSGIGPMPLLTQLGISVLRGHPGVGQNFQDHPGIRLNIPLKRSAQLPHGDVRHIGVVGRYTSGVAGTGDADMQIVSMNMSSTAHDAVNDAAQTDAKHGFGIGAVTIWLNECFSTGHVMITSTDPLEDPEIDENMLSDPRDVARLRLAADVLFAVSHQPSVQAVIAEGGEATLEVQGGGGGGVDERVWSDMSVAQRDQWVRENCFDCQVRALYSTSSLRRAGR